MYHIAVSFDVPVERRDDFIKAAFRDGRDSIADESGTKRFELIVDEENSNRFYLNEAYEDKAAFDVHREGPHFAAFFATIEGFAEGPTWLIDGTRLDDREESSPLVIIASFQARAGCRERLMTELQAMIEPSLAEPGCLGYQPYVDPLNPDGMIIVEEWVDQAALDHHFTTPHFQQVADALRTILARPFVHRRLNNAE